MNKGKQKGITLIALIITIIVILILVAVSVRTISKSGLFDHAKEATRKWGEAQEQEANLNIDEYIEEINAPRFVKVSVGEYHSMALDTEGNIWTWGENGAGNLGNGTTTDSLIPQKIENLNTKFKEISAGNSFCMTIDIEGNIWTWGYNYNGQLGDGTTTNRAIPKKIVGIETKFKKIAAGWKHCIAIDTEGNIWTWGENGAGNLGNGTTTDSLIPQKIENLGVKFKEISAESQSLALDEQGNIWVWGYNYYGELGIGTNSNISIPQKLSDLGTTFKAIGANHQYSVALDIDGNIWSWGQNYDGILGEGEIYSRETPQKISGSGASFERISAGDGSCLLLDKEGNIWILGRPNYGNLGIYEGYSFNTPKKVVGLEESFKEISAGHVNSDTALAISKTGEMYKSGSGIGITQIEEEGTYSWTNLAKEMKYLAIELAQETFTIWNKKITFVKSYLEGQYNQYYLDKEGNIWYINKEPAS